MVVKRTFLLIPVLLVLFSCNVAAGKQADLAGTWYPSNPKSLEAEIREYIKNARLGKIDGDVIGVVAPHAGLRYSGPVAAYSYKAAMGQDPELAVVVGFTHRKYFPRVSAFIDEAYVTPLGPAVVDQETTRELIAYSNKIESIPAAFYQENSVEMEIPFIQVAFKNAKVVLLAMGDQGYGICKLLGEALYDVLRDKKNYVIIASTDMCHYMPYEAANERDAKTIGVIKKFDPEAIFSFSDAERRELMCGSGAVAATMFACRKLGADKVEILNYANSGDTSGMKDRVVGYMSAAFIRTKGEKREARPAGANKEGKSMFSREQKDKLLKMARDTIEQYLKTGKRLEVEAEDEALKEEMGAFVTLHKNGQLRGCIGHIIGTQPFYLTVRDMAIASATEDPRFPTVTLDELDDIDIEISALSPMEKVEDYNEIK
ncbi:MAG: AmmeMemoRadiSam system protein B, partial [Candidatus Omnitrophota bacterium]